MLSRSAMPYMRRKNLVPIMASGPKYDTGTLPVHTRPGFNPDIGRQADSPATGGNTERRGG